MGKRYDLPKDLSFRAKLSQAVLHGRPWAGVTCETAPGWSVFVQVDPGARDGAGSCRLGKAGGGAYELPLVVRGER